MGVQILGVLTAIVVEVTVGKALAVTVVLPTVAKVLGATTHNVLIAIAMGMGVTILTAYIVIHHITVVERAVGRVDARHVILLVYALEGSIVMSKVSLPVEESLKRIMATPLLTCIMRPWKGSAIHTLIDKNVDTTWLLMAIAFTWEAVERNEPRVTLKKVRISAENHTQIQLDYEEDGVEKILTYGDAYGTS